MIPAARRKIGWGVGLGVVLVLGTLAGLFYSGVLPWPPWKAKPKALCYVSPNNPNFIKAAPGKDLEGNALLPVYPSGTPGQPPPPAVAPQTAPKKRKIKYWVAPMDPNYRRDKPGKSPMGMDLVPVYEEGTPAQVAPKKRKIKYWVAPMDPNYRRDKPGKSPMGMDLVPVYEEGTPAPAAKSERKIKYWVDQMDPTYIRDKPGKGPCGLPLVPVYESSAEEVPGVIRVSPAAIQSMGVTTTKVQVRPLSRVTLTVGTVTFDERGLNVLTTKVNGWVDRLYVNAMGDPVRRGQTLLSIYSPDLVSAQQEYLLALTNLKAMGSSPVKEMAEGARRLAEAARQRLAYFDISPAQINALERTGQARKHLLLFSPANGYVTKRMVTQGMYVKAGMPLLEVADLSTIWVDADIYQYELPWIKVGQPVIMSLEYLPGETFRGKVDYIYPYLNEATRTVKVRLRFPNPGLKLKPAMFSQVKIESPVVQNAVVVPADAIINTGLSQHVFIALGRGRFVPQKVKLGVLGNNGMRQILSGLKGGEEVVTSAQFMLDSESRFRSATKMMAPALEKAAKPEAPPAAMPGMKMEGEKQAPPTPPQPKQ